MALHIKGKSAMNGIKVVFDSNAAIKLLEKKLDLASLGIDIDKTPFFLPMMIICLTFPGQDTKQKPCYSFSIHSMLPFLTVLQSGSAFRRLLAVWAGLYRLADSTRW
jgi:hypothetical protein